MKWLFWLLALFAVAAIAALSARFNEGYVLLIWPPYRAEVSLNLILAALALGFVALHLALRALTTLFGLPARVARYRAQREQERGQKLFHDAFRLLFEGRFGQALRKASEAYEADIDPGLSALIAARSAQRMRRAPEQQLWLQRAGEADAQSQDARLMLEAEMSLDSRDFSSALTALEALQKKSGRNLAAQRLELRARQGVGDWPAVLELARQLEKRGVLPAEVAVELKLRAHRENIFARRTDAKSLLSYLREVPKAETGARLTLVVAKALIELSAFDDAAKVIEAQLAQGWDAALATLYGQCGGERITPRIAEAEKWLQQHRSDAGLLLALGRLCVQQQLWGKATSYLEASLSIEESRDAHLELAWLADKLGRRDEADRRYRLASKPELCHCN